MDVRTERIKLTTEAQQLLDAAFAGTLNMDAVDTTTTKAEPPQAVEKAPAQPAAQDEPEGAPIASKSGTYQIPYEKLTEARSQRDQFKAEAEQLKAQLAQLTAAQAQNLAAAQVQAQNRAEAGQAPTDADKNLAAVQAAAEQGVDIDVFGDFSEEAIAKGVATLVEQRTAALVDAKLKEVLAPMQQREAQAAVDAHAQAIYAAHKDADEIYESSEFKAWVNGQPGYAQAAIEQALTKGAASEVIEVFTAFKAAHSKPNPAAAVSKAMEAAQSQPPMSLSDLSGATSTSDAERMAQLAGDPVKLLDFMAGLSPEKQNRLMNSVV